MQSEFLERSPVANRKAEDIAGSGFSSLCSDPANVRQSRPGGQTAVDDERRAGDKRRFVRGEEQYRIGDLFRFAHTPQWMRRSLDAAEVVCAVLAEKLRGAGVDISQAKAIHPDVVLRDLERRRA